MTPDQIRASMKKEGMAPTRPYNERPILITTTGWACVLFLSSNIANINLYVFSDTILEPFLPPEGDGKVSTLSKEGAKQRYSVLENKGKNMIHLRKLRRFEEEFDSYDFALKAQDLYIEAHNTLVRWAFICHHWCASQPCRSRNKLVRLIDWLIACLSTWLIYCFTVCSIDWLIEWMIDWLIYLFIYFVLDALSLFFIRFSLTSRFLFSFSSGDHDKLHDLVTENAFPVSWILF